MQFFDSVDQNLHHISIKTYLKFMDALIHTPGRLHDLTFAIYDISGTLSICEHDVF